VSRPDASDDHLELMLSPEQLAFAQRQRVAHLATTGADGQPHVVPVTFVLLGGALYFVIDQKPKRTTRLKRLRNIEENSSVAIVIDRYDDDWSKLAWIMVQGAASIVGSQDEQTQAVAALAEKYSPYRGNVPSGPVVRIVPAKVLSWGNIS
jgi:PPOX class probable F420-dependent enzyme